ncbi:hypothetical protein AG1IA_10158 [Rhizoctonia solani AG-1 IA]|uniref:Uncharacterized protein n=1 Tax=Thanatephorus cucumeris (strain AG1-IA) TaxID=983506 RepID=L8WGI2_THACA|nr:hypothetical protein AG1IA_10158 [Rhizoctonia solani AG-1 IA]
MHFRGRFFLTSAVCLICLIVGMNLLVRSSAPYLVVRPSPTIPQLNLPESTYLDLNRTHTLFSMFRYRSRNKHDPNSDTLCRFGI